MKNNILFVEWACFGTPFLIQSFEKNGYKIDRYSIPRKEIDTRRDIDYTEKLVHRILSKTYAAVFTINYFPIVAIACKACRIPYISWTYDSPFVQLYSKTIAYETNIIFVFDNHTVQELRGLGCNNVFYLPMAVPDDYYINLQKKNYNKAIYESDISFVGSMYSEDFQNPFRKMKELTGYYKGMIEGIIEAQRKVYGYSFLQEILIDNPDLVKKIHEICPVTITEDSLETMEWIYANYYLARSVTAKDREILLKKISEQYNVRVYTPERKIENMDCRGKVDYYTEAPYVYSNSKINLNISLRSIQTGIPLRAFDIMGNGGCLLTNYQQDFLEYFEPDKDLLMYGSDEEAMEKIKFYLENDSAREKIANSGFQKVMNAHTYSDRIKVISNFLEEYWD